MSYPVLEKLPEHLKIISDTKQNPELVVLSALLRTEMELSNNWARFGDKVTGLKRRIAWSIMVLYDSTDHCGDCVKMACSCMLCHSISHIEEALEALALAKERNIDMSGLINILVATQPPVAFQTAQEANLYYATHGMNAYMQQIVMPGDIEERLNYNGQIQDVAGKLIDYAKQILQLDQETLSKWWTTNDNSLIMQEKLN